MREKEDLQLHYHPPKAVPQAPLADQVGQLDTLGLSVQRVPHSRLERRWDVEVRIVSYESQTRP